MARGRGTIGYSGEPAQDNSKEPTRLNEEDVLLPIINQLHPDNWPCFVLKDAVVYSKDGETPANLLNAELDGPMVVRGRLEVDKDFRQLLKPKRPRGSVVEVTDVKGFSMGIGPVTIWASGKAGWFEIRPAPSYQRIYDKMAEGITLHYFLTELYENKRALAGNPTMYVDEIFELYSKQIDKTKSAPEVAQLCEEHAAFLLSQMRKPSEPIRWTRTSFYMWLTKRRPDIHARYSRKPDPNIPIVIEDDSMEDQPPTETSISNRTQSNPSTTAVIVQVMKELHTSGAVRRQSMTIDILSRALCERYDVADLNLAREIIKVHAKTILTSLEKEWTASPMYSKLEECLSQPVGKKSALRRDAKMIELRARHVEDEVSNDEKPQKYAVGIEPPIMPRGRRKRSYQREQEENTGSLEAVSGSATRSQRHRSIDKGKGKQAVTSESDAQPHFVTRSRLSDDEEHSPLARPIRRAGKKAALRLAGSSITQEKFEDGRSNKRPKISHSDDNDDSEASSLNDISPKDENREIEEVLTVVTHLLPSTSPQGPNGLWTCPTDGCKFLVGAADKPDAQAMIRAHFLEHAEEISKMENLVLEESRPYLPTIHLLEKLRALGEAARHSEERRIAGRIVPAPIKRRMAV